jgi:NADH-quinone oxidoreductase subunit L
VVTLPLVLLAIPSVMIGYIAIGPMVFGDYFKGVIFIDHHAHPAWSIWPSTSMVLQRWVCIR